MVQRQELVAYIDELLDAGTYQDSCPNGLQVEGRREIGHLVTGVTASLMLLEQAVESGADAILVHHGLFWKGEAAAVVGMKQRRLKQLLCNDVNLLAWHLPLDAHPVYGNNARLAKLLGLRSEGGFGGSPAIGMVGRLSMPVNADAFAERITRQLGRTPFYIPAGPETITTIAWCSGAAQSWLDQAVELGVDAFLTGEVSEPTVHTARESGIHFFAAGHHATERYGVKALGEHLAQRFNLEHRFIDIDNPI